MENFNSVVLSLEIKQLEGERVFVIGDIHGCLEELLAMLDWLEKEEALTQDDLVVFLGDYIDRGYSSAQVVQSLIQFKDKFPKTAFLKGNHEDMLLDFLDLGGRLGDAFLYNGGLETIQSYGLSVFSPPQEIVESIPVDHMDFFRTLIPMATVDSFLMVHAGLNPAVPLDKQITDDIYWIRENFLGLPHDFKKTIIFGHTPHKTPFLDLPYKVGLDTGLVFGNKLSCLELRSGRLLSVLRGEERVNKSRIKLKKVF